MADAAASLEALRSRLAVIADLSQALALMRWDQSTMMPRGGAAGRAGALSSLERLRHERLVDPALADLVAELEGASLGGDDAALVRETRRDVERAAKQPADLVARRARASSLGREAWQQARADADFALFAPHLREHVELAREMAAALDGEAEPYDVLHDGYERGSTAAAVEATFAPLRASLVELVGAIRESGGTCDTSPVLQSFDEAGQERFALEVATLFGYDLHRGRLDRTVHPFASRIGRGDVRITTRYDPHDLRNAIFAIWHEAGHGMYEQGLPDAYAGTPLGTYASLGVHESQSRLWENLVGRSLAFWEWGFERLRAVFPGQLDDVPVERFHAAVNAVTPSFIRVEADEVTYHLHVMARFELEQGLIDGSLDVDDLPAAWNERYEAYLGVTPPDDRVGCLQDVHWSEGGIGYFPTYTLGTLLSVQLWEAMQRDLGDLDEALRRGEFGGISSWLHDRIHSQGRRFTPAELVERATGGPLACDPFLRYAWAKYGALYGF
jgi:carboxypeptidase Taq